MLRDVPKIYLLMFIFVVLLMLLSIWYVNAFERDEDTLQLNSSIMTVAVSEVDQTSRLYEGALLLADTFEIKMWEDLEVYYQRGDSVQFDYLFDTADTRFSGVPSDPVSSPTYILGGAGADIPRITHATHFTGKPIKSVRVKVREKDDKVGTWTYKSTISVDAASK